jgi:hypothetical protein
MKVIGHRSGRNRYDAFGLVGHCVFHIEQSEGRISHDRRTSASGRCTHPRGKRSRTASIFSSVVALTFAQSTSGFIALASSRGLRTIAITHFPGIMAQARQEK